MEPRSYIGTAHLSSKINPVHTLPPYHFKIHFNIIPALSQVLSNASSFQIFRPEFLYVLLTSSMHATYPSHIILLDVITFRKQIKKLLLYNFLQPSVTSTPLDPSIIHNTLPFILHEKLITPLPKVNVSRNTRHETNNTCY